MKTTFTMKTPLITAMTTFAALTALCLSGTATATPGAWTGADFAARQTAIDELKAGGTFNVNNAANNSTNSNRIYGLAKAQCWLDFSKHEWHRNDRGDSVPQALEESDKLMQQLKAGTVISNETRLVANADKIRTDLWAQADGLKSASGYRCAAAATACAEVVLVQASTNQKQLGWRYANPYVGIAEDMLSYAKAEEAKCRPAPVIAAAPLVVVSPPPPPPPAPVVIPRPQQITLQASALFKFDKSSPTDILPAGKVEMDDAIAKLKSFKKIISIRLTGHTDRLGTETYNEKLSMSRALTVKDYFTKGGIAADLMSVKGEASRSPVKTCDDKSDKALRNTKALTDCLQPNRRVTIDFIAE